MAPRRRIAVAVALVGALLSIHASCGGVNVSRQVTTVAVYGKQVSEILVQAQTVVVTGQGTVPGLTEAVVAQAQAQFLRISVVETQLADALALYDALPLDTPTAQRSLAITDLSRILDRLRSLTRDVLLWVGANRIGDELLHLYDNLDAVFREIQIGLSHWQATAQGARP